MLRACIRVYSYVYLTRPLRANIIRRDLEANQVLSTLESALFAMDFVVVQTTYASGLSQLLSIFLTCVHSPSIF